MNEQLPQHVAIVMDGNGRWAENKKLLRFEGHRAGVLSVKAVIKSCIKHDIPILSLFAFSSENWRRPPQEVEFLMALFIESLQSESAELHDNQIKLNFLGAKEALSPRLQQQMQSVERLTAGNRKLELNIAVNYGGQWDILQAVKQMVQQVVDNKLTLDEINEQTCELFLSTHHLPAPDLFIRTSGEKRISNFFLWQLAYTELYFTDTLWPDFNEQAFEQALKSFQARARRFGNVSSTLEESLNV